MALRLLRVLVYFNSKTYRSKIKPHLLSHTHLGVQFILRALGHSFVPLLHLGWFIFCIMLFFALIGIELDTTGNLHQGCFVNYTDQFGM